MQKRKKFHKARRPSSHGPDGAGQQGPSGAHPVRTGEKASGFHKRPPGARDEARGGRPSHKAFGGGLWLYGVHAVCAALENPARQLKSLLVTETSAETIRRALNRAGSREGHRIQCETVARSEIDALFPADTVHQGAALLVSPLDPPALDDILESLKAETHALVVVLDQVDDPRNVGAVLRSAAAFGASAVVLPERHAPAESGALAKAASGALELIPLVRVTNIARALEILKSAGFWCIGLAPAGQRDLNPPDPPSLIALVLGAEGSGLRRLTLERCDEAARIPLAGPVASLNLSAATAIALYAFRSCARARPPSRNGPQDLGPVTV